MNDTRTAFEEKLLTIDLVDALRREEQRLDLALSDQERMSGLREEIRAYYGKAGITVSEELIDKAVAERQAQRYRFQPPSLSGAGRLIAHLYIRRKALAISLTAVFGLVAAGWLIDQQVAAWQHARADAAWRDGLQTQISAIQSTLQGSEKLPAVLPVFPASAVAMAPQWQEQLSKDYAQARTTLLQAAPCANLQIDDAQTTPWDGEKQVRACHANKDAFATAQNRAQQILQAQADTARALTQFADLQTLSAAQPALFEWPQVRDGWSEAQTQALRLDGRAAFVAAVGAADTVLTAARGNQQKLVDAEQCVQSALSQASGADRAALEAVQAQGKTLRSEINADAGRWVKETQSLCEFFGATLELQITTAKREKTGVERRFDRRHSGYYIIADVLTPAGSAGKARVTDAERNELHQVSRIGVRTSKEHFEAIKRDKKDDGLIADRLIGRKPANSLQWQLAEPYQTQFIVEW